MDNQSLLSVSGPLWLTKVNPTLLALLREGQEKLEVVCDPPLPAPLPPGSSVTLFDGDRAYPVRLFPVPENPALLLAITEPWAFALCSPYMEELVNHIAHDLRNLIFTASLQAEIAQRQTQEAKPHLDTILAQLGRVQQYLERLLVYGRKPHLSLSNLNLETFVQEKLRAFRQRWPANLPPLSLRLRIDPEVGVARWDPQLIGAALDAVLENAAQASHQGEEVELLVSGTPEEVTLEVRDHGSGIPPELLPKLFFPMAVRRPQGMGLGLAIAKKLVDAHGGKLELFSSPQGTTVRLVLPREVCLA